MRIEVAGSPEYLIDCNCSICRRYGALWAFYELRQSRIEGAAEHADGYIWGEKTISTFHCRHCGCVTHWEPLALRPDSKFSINARLLEPSAIEGVRVRRFDGADSWSYLD
ncbi:hypothetical protein SNE35_03965 [Paucibacter sp. R3-3]|uniref:CENP-V/GFA domain-containing protein n=1 Tax=Roseateles agri TaxID=3098619 RepID=A0ABU5DD48_9BURK|nr:hypothetical protein [Paucibacter sp. R3-3]MDY0743643.1 hypothetical protein [Paucibacter sp. R3-3]